MRRSFAAIDNLRILLSSLVKGRYVAMVQETFNRKGLLAGL